MTQTTPELNSTEQLYTKLKKFHEVYLKLMEKLNLYEDGAYYGNDELKELLKKLDINDEKSVKRVKSIFCCKFSFIRYPELAVY